MTIQLFGEDMVEPLNLPTDHPRPAFHSYDSVLAEFVLDERLTTELKELSQHHRTTLFITLLAGWSVLLARLSGQEYVVIGTSTANLGGNETENQTRFFANTRPFRLDLSGSLNVSELLKQARAQLIVAQQHQDIPCEQVCELAQPVRGPVHSPPFQVTFAWRNAPKGALELSGLDIGLQSSLYTVAEIDLTLFLQETGTTISGGTKYATSLFERATIERYLGHFRTLLQAMVSDDSRAVDRLSMLTAPERHQVLYGWNDTKSEFPADRCVHQLFEEQVEKTPDATAVLFEEASLTYAELNRRANRLAHRLRKLGVIPEDRVAICVERGFEMIAGLLAVLKAGGAYVPLDPAYPVERIRFMLNDCEPVALLTQKHLGDIVLDLDSRLPVLSLDEAAAWLHQPEDNIDPGVIGLTPQHLAYVIYTSGSTGVPKGVMVQHRSVCNLVADQIQGFAVTPDSRILQFASFSFDACVSEVLVALSRGASLYLPARGAMLAGVSLTLFLTKNSITHVTLPPAVLRSLSEETKLNSVHTLIVAGEPLANSLAERWMEGRRLINAYGPTEGTVCATMHYCLAESNTPPIGRPIANTQVYILDSHCQPVPVGVAGELYIGGAGVARGYLNRPELTAERFLADPFSSEPRARIYKTGDLGRWLPDGSIEFLGRNDFQVKIRGFRIELGEIEAHLSEHASVREAVVIAREDTPDDKCLVAYYTSVNDEIIISAELLRSHLSDSLPEYMIPVAYVRLKSLPLTPNGKLDRKALPAPDGEAYVARGHELPQGEMETGVAAIWAEVLKLDRIGRNDNFFELGGHSLSAVTLVARLRQALGVDVTISDLFAHPVVSDLTRIIERVPRAQLARK
jgi:amino acid adenylation domain-containing protein